MTNFDVLVIGGGIAGVSIASELAKDRSVCLVEMESTLGFHTTGRSAATFLESFGNATIRSLTVSSRSFLEQPPESFHGELLTPRPLLQFAGADGVDSVHALHREAIDLVPDVMVVDADLACEMCPILRPEAVGLAFVEPRAQEIDVHALHQGYARSARRGGAVLIANAGVLDISRSGGMWHLASSDGETRSAPVAVNAAGSWADRIATLAGVRPVGIQPLTRSVFMAGSTDTKTNSGMPFLGNMDGTFYVKPEGEQFLCSPADETPSEPRHARPDMLEIARAIDEINACTMLDIRSVRTSWAGLRNFVADRDPVVGFAEEADGFFWLAGQGGYGIQTAPAVAQLSAALIRGTSTEVGLHPDLAQAMSPTRPSLQIEP